MWRRSALRAAGGALTVGLCVLAAVTAVQFVRPAAAAARAGDTVALAPSGDVVVHWRGNGHGHGMSQYGAHGAAIAGLSARQILAFYYPHTTLADVGNPTIRVRLSDTGSYLTVWSGTEGLSVTTFGALPATGYSRFRLAPKGSGLHLLGRRHGAWHELAGDLPARADFRSDAGYVRVAEPGGTSTSYRGAVGAVRQGSGEIVVNRVRLDDYVTGVVPREMPASWQAPAVRAQAVAARTYASNQMAENGGGAYDICDTTQCQVYGGMTHYDTSGNVAYTDDPAAIAHNRGDVLTYHDAPIFAQYSASNGGATVDGGQPYLVGKADPYDDAASGDPYLDQSRSVPVADLADYFGLHTVTGVRITERTGFGPWGGRVEQAYVDGTDADGATVHVPADGFDLGAALGVWTDYLRLVSDATAPSAPRSVQAQPGNAGATISWRAPADSGHSAITGYRLHFGRHTVTVPGSARSAWAGPLPNSEPSTVTVRAVNGVGTGPATAVSVQPAPSPQFVHPMTPRRLFDSRASHRTVDHAHPYRFDVAGAGLPDSVGSVQLVVSVEHPSASGVLSVYSWGVRQPALAAIAYSPGQVSTATVSVPTEPATTLVFRPSRGRVVVFADRQSYTTPSGPRLRSLPPRTAAKLRVRPHGGATVSFGHMSGVDAGTRAVLLNLHTWASTRTWLRLWRDGAHSPSALHLAVGPDRSRTATVLVPVSASHRIHVAAAAPVNTRITLVGVAGSSGGRLESFPAAALADGASALSVGRRTVRQPLLDAAQVPDQGVRAVLLQVTVRPHGAGGTLWAWPAGTTRPHTASVIFGGSAPVTTTVLVRIRASGALALRGSVPGLRVSLDTIGYVSSR